MEETARMLTIAEVAAATGLSRKAVARRVERGSLTSVLGPDNRRRVSLVELVRAGLLTPDGRPLSSPPQGPPGRFPERPAQPGENGDASAADDAPLASQPPPAPPQPSAPPSQRPAADPPGAELFAFPPRLRAESPPAEPSEPAEVPVVPIDGPELIERVERLASENGRLRAELEGHSVVERQLAVERNERERLEREVERLRGELAAAVEGLSARSKRRW